MNPTKAIIKKVKETILRYGMVSRNDIIIVAVSGGPDSVCLLDILNELKDDLKIELVVAHFNHGLREQEDEPEDLFVRALTRTLNLTYETRKAPDLLGTGRGSLEERARNARYDFLENVRGKHKAQRIALGHNLNDQAETVLMRLLRGSGLSGLAGIPPCRDNIIIRPLIHLPRPTLKSYIEVRGLSFLTDSTNLESHHLRNRIRLELLPALLEYQPRLVEHLGELSVIFREEDDYLQGEARRWVTDESKVTEDGVIQIPVASFLRLPRPMRNRVTREILKGLKGHLRRINRRHLRSVTGLASSAKPQGLIDLPHGITVKKRYVDLIFSSNFEASLKHIRITLDRPGTYFLDARGLSFSLSEMDAHSEIDIGRDLSLKTSGNTAYLDAENVHYPLTLRGIRPGDRFIPFGMRGHRKIKDFFIDLKVPMETRQKTLLMTCWDIPVWLCGFRIDDRFKVTDSTLKILKIEMTPMARKSEG